MALHIHKGKGTDVPNSSHIHSEVMKKVNDLQRTRAEPEEQEQRSEEWGQELLQEGDLGKQGEAEKGLLRGPHSQSGQRDPQGHSPGAGNL